MPGKSRHHKRKLSRSKRIKGRQGVSAISTQPQAVAQTVKPAPRAKVRTPSASIPSSMANLAAARYPYIAAELRRIGILAGLILVILVILALVFS